MIDTASPLDNTTNREMSFKIFCGLVLEEIDKSQWQNAKWFKPDYGLCFTAFNYEKFYLVPVVDMLNAKLYEEVRNTSRTSAFPFNETSDEYFREQDMFRVYENKERLAFLRKWAGQEG